jgi:hypothetical protein
VRELPNDEDREIGERVRYTDAESLQVFADLRVLKRDAPDLYEKHTKWKITIDEAMQILEGRQRRNSTEDGL